MGMKSIPVPEAPAFEMAIAVEPADIDELGHVNNVVYVRWVQDIAVALEGGGVP